MSISLLSVTSTDNLTDTTAWQAAECSHQKTTRGNRRKWKRRGTKDQNTSAMSQKERQPEGSGERKCSSAER